VSAFLTQIVLREWLMTPLVILLAVLPGLGFAAVVARRIRLSWPETIVASFAFSVAMTSVVATACYLARLRLDVVLAAYLAFIPVSLWFFVKEYRGGHLRKPTAERAGLILAGVTALAAMIERPWFRSGADTFYHLAATRSLLATQRALVTDPFHGTGIGVLDPTSGVWHTIQAIMSRALFTDIATLYLGVTALGAGMIVLAFWVLARRVGGNAKAATIATVAMVAVAYHFDFRVMAYPKHLSEALLFFGIAALARLLDEPRWPDVALAAVVGVATTTMHLAAAEFLFLAGGFIMLALGFGAVMERAARDERYWGRQLGMTACALGLTAAASVPILLPKVGALSGSSVIGADSFLRLSDHVMTIGNVDIVRFGGMYTGGPLLFFAMLVLIAFTLPAAYRDRDPHALAAVALMAMIPLVLNDPVLTPFALHFSSYMTSRMAALMRFMPFVGIAWALGKALPGRERLMPRLAAAAIALALVGAGPDLVSTATGFYVPGFERGLDVYGLGATLTMDIRASWGVETIEKIRRVVGDGYPVVAAEPHTSYYIAGILPVSVVATQISHSPAAIEVVDGPQRRADMEEFFASYTSASTRRALVRRYHIRYVVIWKTRLEPEVEAGMLQQDGLFKRAVSSEHIDLLRVTDDLSARP
jgi:hypothetical protein